MPLFMGAALWGLPAGSALLIGATLGYFLSLPARLIAGIMAAGPGVLISAVAFDLVDEAFELGGFDSTALGFLAGAAVCTGVNFAGLITVAGFLAAFVISKPGVVVSPSRPQTCACSLAASTRAKSPGCRPPAFGA